MKSYVIHFALVFGASVSALFALDALFEPSGGPRIEAPHAPPPVEAGDDAEVKEYFHPHYDDRHTLAWTIKGGRARGLTGKNVRLWDTEFTLVHYRGDMQEARRVTVSAPEAWGEWDKEGKGAISFAGRVEISTTDGIVLRTSDLRCSFARGAQGGGDDPFGGWNWEFSTERDVEISGPGFEIRGSGLQGVRDEMKLLIPRNPSASIGRGLSEISEFKSIGDPAGMISVRAGGPLVLTAGAPAEATGETAVRVRFENRAVLADFAPDGAGGFRAESLLGSRVLEADMAFFRPSQGKGRRAEEGKAALLAVRGEGGVRYANLDAKGRTEAAFSGNSLAFERPRGGEGASFRISGVPRAVLLSSSSITSGLAGDAAVFPRRPEGGGPCNLIWMASDTEFAASTDRASAAAKDPGSATIGIPRGATLASYVRLQGGTAAVWDRVLSHASGFDDIPTVESLRAGFRPELVLTSETVELNLRKSPSAGGERGSFVPESFRARGDARVLDYGESGEMESYCRAEDIAYSEAPAAEGGADLRREVRIEGEPRMGFRRDFALMPWSDSVYAVKRKGDGPAVFTLSCRKEMYNITYLKSAARGGEVARQIINLEEDVRVDGFVPEAEAGAGSFTPALEPAPGWRKQLSARAGSAEMVFLPRAGGKAGADLDSFRAGGGVAMEILDPEGRMARSASGRDLEWSAGGDGQGNATESCALTGDARLGLSTSPNPFPLRPASGSGEDWVEVSSPDSIRYFRKIPPRDAPGAVQSADVFAPKDAEVSVTPLELRGKRIEWKLRADSAAVSCAAPGAGTGVRWSPCAFKASGSVIFYNYNAAGSVEAWGRGGSLAWSGNAAGGKAPEQWILGLDGAPMVQFPVDGVFLAQGTAHTPRSGGGPRDAWVRIEAARRMEISAKAFGTPSEVVTLRAEGNAVLTASGVLENEESRSFLKMEAPEIWCDSAVQEPEGGGKPVRSVRETRGAGETAIAIARPDGTTGLYKGADLSFNPGAGEGEKRVFGPGKWTFELVRGSK